MSKDSNASLKSQLYIAGFLPILICGDIYIYYYSVLAIFFLRLELNKKIDFKKLLIYTIGIISFLINLDIKILLSIAIVYLYDEIIIVEYNKYVGIFYYFICSLLILLYIFNIGSSARLELFNNNVFNAVLFVYISIFALNFSQCSFSLPVILLFASRTSLIAWIIWFLSYRLKINESIKINFTVLFFCMLIFFCIGLFDQIDTSILPYHQDIDRLLKFNDNSLGSRFNQYIVFINNLDFNQILTNAKKAHEITTELIMMPHSTVATLLEKGGIFYLIFIYAIAAFRVRSIIFLPIFMASLFLHSAFIPHILILIEKFKKSENF